MAKTPSDILKKTKALDTKSNKDDKDDSKKPDTKRPGKSALLDFISSRKKMAK